ncbi:MAG TPA: hypothetical protein ENN13_05540 [Candidatus Altiarchaeales archaeon]|nr:hypothetical protein [Candidatus Altiarchaeales archaeon]
MALSRIHFLVHPAYSMAVREHTGIPYGSLEQAEAQLEKYEGKIREISRRADEALVIFTASSAKRFMEDAKIGGQPWMKLAKEAKKRLGGRCIVFSSPAFLPNSDIEPHPQSSRQEDTAQAIRLKEILKQRNLNLTEETEPHVWGEKAKTCVIQTARWIEKNIPEIKTPVIDLPNTEISVIDPDTVKNMRETVKIQHLKTKIKTR